VNVTAVLELHEDLTANAKVNWHLRTDPKITLRKPAVTTEEGTNYIFDTKQEALEALIAKVVDFGVSHLEVEIRV